MSTTSVTSVDDQEVVPSLPQIALAIPLVSTRALVAQQLGRGHTADAVTGSVAAWLAHVVDWRTAGVPSGRLGTTGEATLRAAVRVLVDAVERDRQPPPVHRSPTPRPTRPAPVARVEVERIALEPDPSEER